MNYRAVTISYLPPPGDRLVWHAPHRGSAHNYYLSAGPCPSACVLRSMTVGTLSPCSARSNELLRTPLERSSDYSAYLRRFERADEQTRTADLLTTSDPSGVAGVCTGLQMPHI
jgi:hypothetical protein